MYIRFNSSCCKTFLVYFICLSILFRPTFAHADVGGWTLSNPIAQGASTLYQGAKNVLINGKNVAKTSTALITPTATQVAKVLARGAAGYALSVAVEQLLGAVDWVLDPVNNQIRYKDPDSSNSCTAINGCGAVDYYLFRRTPTVMTYYTSVDATCRAVAASFSQTLVSVDKTYDSKGRVSGAMCRTKRSNGISDNWGLDVNTNPAYDPNATDENREKTIPLEVVAAKVISNAEGGDAAAQQATKAAAADIIAEAETDSTKARPITKQLEANAETATDETATGESVPKDPTAPDATKPTNISLEFPKFCGWAPSVCEAAQVVISFPTLVTEWWDIANNKADGWASSIAQSWAAAKEWAKEEEKPKVDDTPQIQEPDLNISVTNYIQFGSQCPQDREIPLSMGGQTLNLVISYQPLCIVAQQFRPAVILMAFLAGAFIITNTGRRAETGD